MLSRITIPEGVSTIGLNVFQTGNSLTNITLPSSITSIGNSAFTVYPSLAELHIKAQTPPTLGTNAFANLANDFKIYVPTGKGATYKAATGWSDYSTLIVEETA